MKQLKDILYNVHLESSSGDTGVVVAQIAFDSRVIEPGTVFVAVKGVHSDGHDFISMAVEKGAAAIVCQERPASDFAIPVVTVKDSAEALGIMASNYYDNPSNQLKLVGVTGTNGKTTTATLLFNLFRELGYNTGLLSTVENKINEKVIPSTHTTPDAIGLNALMRKMVDSGCTHCFMEVSSHAIVQRRIAGLDFDGALFTNISHDHLDYHKTFDEYIKAKKLFFDKLPKKAFALINGDDKRANVMVQNCAAEVRFYALKTMADYKARILSNTLQGLELEINNVPAWFKLIGHFNAYNLLAVYGTAIGLDEEEEQVLTAMSLLNTARGRFEQVVSPSEIIGIVDYAHTPDALDNVLDTINDLKPGNASVITVVGCGGDRDKEKRPKMADIACKKSDRVIITSDNPRSESPADIIRDMKAGVNAAYARKVLVVEDRKEAIKLACTFANKHDVLLVAGKGHENYQEINGVKHHFDDREELLSCYQLLEK